MLSLARKLILRASRRDICDAERLCTDAALALDAPTRVAAAAGSGVLDVRLCACTSTFEFPLFSAFLSALPVLEYTVLVTCLL
jgi:hypothetical protein